MKFCVFISQIMAVEYERWMSWYGKKHGPYQIEKGDFLCEEVKDKINNATWVSALVCQTSGIIQCLQEWQQNVLHPGELTMGKGKRQNFIKFDPEKCCIDHDQTLVHVQNVFSSQFIYNGINNLALPLKKIKFLI